MVNRLRLVRPVVTRLRLMDVRVSSALAIVIEVGSRSPFVNHDHM